jgi:hypothetical protein
MADGLQKDWPELCAAVTNESDSTKPTSLVHELIEASDKGERAGVTPFPRLTLSRRIAKPLEKRAKSMNDFASPTIAIQL